MYFYGIEQDIKAGSCFWKTRGIWASLLFFTDSSCSPNMRILFFSYFQTSASSFWRRFASSLWLISRNGTILYIVLREGLTLPRSHLLTQDRSTPRSWANTACVKFRFRRILAMSSPEIRKRFFFTARSLFFRISFHNCFSRMFILFSSFVLFHSFRLMDRITSSVFALIFSVICSSNALQKVIAISCIMSILSELIMRGNIIPKEISERGRTPSPAKSDFFYIRPPPYNVNRFGPKFVPASG